METAHDTSMRDDLNAAFDSLDEEMVETPQEIISSDEPDEITSETEEDSGEVVEGEAAEPAPTPETAEATPDGELVEGEKPDTRSTKAPVGWSPKEREDWSKIPPHLQKKVVARENELNTMLATTGEARKTHDEFTRLTDSYGAVVDGVFDGSPIEVVESLLDTVGRLRMGTQVEKAQTVASLINMFGVDVSALDSMLVGEVPQANPHDEVRAIVAEQMQPFNNLMQQGEQQEHDRQMQMQQEAKNGIQTFIDSGKAEFLADVRNDMADFIDMAQKRGVNMPLQEAYDRACQLNPEVRSVLEQRSKLSGITQGQSDIARKQQAALSISGRKSGGGAAPTNLTLRDTIMQAMDNGNSV